MRHDPGPTGLHVRKFGRGSQTLLLIHGFTDSSDTWSRVVPTLAKHYRVIAVDLPGFGRASRNWPQPIIPGYVELLRELICKQRRKQVTVIGNSLGAVVALALATEHPHLVDRVVLADMPGIDGTPRWWGLIGARHTERLARLLALPVPPPLLQHAMGHAFLYLGLRHPHQDGHDELRKAFHTHYASKSHALALLPFARQLFSELAELPVRRMIRELQAPVLLLWGQHDLLTPSKKARSFVNGPTRRVVVIPDCGHLPQVDRPQEFVDTVLGFLERQFALAG